MDMQSQPGLFTFLFTDLQGSTRLWEQHPELMKSVLAQHDALLNETIAAHGGRVVKTTGDGVHAVFETAGSGLRAALVAQLALQTSDWPDLTEPLRVRMGLHTGEAQYREGDYFGTVLNRAARLMSIGHGGQILLSGVTAGLVQEALPPETTLADLGDHHLRDLSHPEHVFQVCHPALAADFPSLRSLAAFQHNLPLQLNTFIGRERELAEIRRLLHQGRLVTLLGPGGTGKTRLMLQAAADLLDQYPDGVWLVELAALADPALLAERVAAVFEVQAQSNRPILETLLSYLRRKHLLLLLDNVEHLVAESAALAEQLLSRCPQLSILVTGRESLFIAGETTFQVPSLGLPAGDDEITPEVLAQSEAAQLFLARAQAVRPGFEFRKDNAAAVAEIVRRLDGIPLALELAAARLQILSAAQIVSRLNDRFQLLTGGRRTALPRQQTLQALIDWSWNLLSESERCLLRRLSVFAGGWTLEAAEAVTDSDGAGLPPDHLYVFDGLAQLVSKSLVIADHQPGSETRYRMLESIHQYAQDRLLEAGEAREVRNQHTAYYTQLMETAFAQFTGPDMLIWINRMFPEIENLRAAQDWSLEEAFNLAVRLAQTASTFWFHFLAPAESQKWLEQVVRKLRNIPPESFPGGVGAYESSLGKITIGMGSIVLGLGENTAGKAYLDEGVGLAMRAGDLEWASLGLGLLAFLEMVFGNAVGMEPLLEQALPLAREHGHPYALATILVGLATLLVSKNEPEQAQLFLAEAQAIQARLRNPRLEIVFTRFQVELALKNRDLKQAREWFARGAQLYLEVKDRFFHNISRSGEAHCLRWMGEYAEAVEIYRETIAHFEMQGHLPAVAHQLECFAYIAAHTGEMVRAAQLVGAAQRLRGSTKSPILMPEEKLDYEKTLTQLGDAMDPGALEAARAAGQGMDVDTAIAYARGWAVPA